MSSNKNIPQLRFPGFTGEWEEKPLSSFLHEHKTKSDGKCEVHSVSVTKGVVNQVEYLGRSFAAADTSKYNLVKPNDIIYTKSPTGAFPYGIVKQNKNPYNVIVSPLYAVYSPINKYVGYILDSYFESPERTNNYLSSLIQKGAKNTINITNDTFVSKCMCLPSDPAEQQKIAECLSEIDNLISAQGEKVDSLKEKKKGMMQQMFPQKGETTPRLRFPGCEGIWKEIELGKVADFQNGYAYNSSTFSKEGNYVIRISDIQDGVISLSTAVRSACVVPEVFKINKGDILIAMSGATTGKIGEYQSDDIAYINQRVGNIKPFDINRKLLLFLLQSDFFTRYLNSILTVGAQPNISSKQICSFRFMLPPTESEQQKIAECLSAIDDMIASESAKLDALKDHKKGLMQHLFPQPNK